MTITQSSQDSGNKSSFNLKAAMVPAIGLILLGVLPEYLKGIYIEHTDTLMAAYVTAGYIFLGSILAGIGVMTFIDIARMRTRKAGKLAETLGSSAAFDWRPGESYLAGKKPAKKAADNKDQDATKS